MQTIIIVAIGILLFFILWILTKFIKPIYIYYACALLIGILVLARLRFTDTFYNVINGEFLDNGLRYVKLTDYVASFARWGLNLSICIIPIALVCKNKTFKNIAVYICLPILIAITFAFGNFMKYFTEFDTLGYYLPSAFRKAEFTFELSLLIGVCLLIFASSKNFFKSFKEVGYLLVSLPFIILITVPMTVPQSLFGYSDINFHLFSSGGTLWFLAIIISILILYFSLRNKSVDTKWAVCYFLAFVMMIQFSASCRRKFDIYELPLQLCNLGIFLTMIAFVFKWQKLFDMLMIVNLQGTVVALMVMNAVEDTGIFNFWQMVYIYEHMLLFIIPVLATSLGLFKLVTKKSLKHAIIGFTVYYFFCVIYGTVLNGFSVDDKKVDYFYIFKDTITNNFPITGFFKSIVVINIGKFTVYPLFYLLVYFAFACFCVITYNAIHYFNRVAIEHTEISKIRKKMWEDYKNAKNKKLDKKLS